jgi:hypothetical protein
VARRPHPSGRRRSRLAVRRRSRRARASASTRRRAGRSASPRRASGCRRGSCGRPCICPSPSGPPWWKMLSCLGRVEGDDRTRTAAVARALAARPAELLLVQP